MENVLKHIYKACDPNNSDTIPVSTLIDFIKPYMPDNLNELHELQALLDPTNTNPSISNALFDRVMSDWIAKIKDEDFNSSFSEISARNDVPVLDVMNGLEESGNMSKSSSHNSVDTLTLEEQVRKLQHQLSKTNNELDLVKQQLACAEEQNESLTCDLSKLQKIHYREQQMNEEIDKVHLEKDEIQEEVSAVHKQVEHLRKTVISLEKQQQTLLAQIAQQENENANLQEKLQKCDKNIQEWKKNMDKMRDELDVKEMDISHLMEIIEDLRSQLDAKIELVTFYTNENHLLKQRSVALENLLRDVCPDGENSPNQSTNIFNSPKLINQLANPISPTLVSPMVHLRRCNTSTPINNTTVELFSTVGIVTVLRSPHKTLKEELLEVGNGSFQEAANEVKRLHGVLKGEEDIKKDLWQSMKRLSNELENNIQERDEVIQNLEKDLEAERNRNKETSTKETETEISICDIECLENQLTALQEELKTKKLLVADSQTQTDRTVFFVDESTETDWNAQMRHLVADLQTQTDSVVCVDKSTETDWRVQIPEIADPKKTNFARQQMKIEKLLERLEKVESELTVEKGINTALASKSKQLSDEIKRITEDLELYREKNNRQTDMIKNLRKERDALTQSAEMSERDSHREKLDLEQEVKSLTNEKLLLNQNLQNVLNRLEMETSTLTNLRAENERLLNNQRQFDAKLKEELIKQIRLKKQIIDTKTSKKFAVLQLQQALAEKDNEMRNLRKQAEFGDVQLFLSVNNNELGRVTSDIVERFKSSFEDALDFDLLGETDELQKQTSTNTDKEMVLLSKNIKLAILLLEIMAERVSETVFESPINTYTYCVSIKESDSLFDESNHEGFDDVFATCMDVSSTTAKEYLEWIPAESESFLENLELNGGDLSHLSGKELEEKFTTLALVLTYEFATLKQRHFDQQEQCKRLLIKFFTYLNYSVELLKRFNKSEDAEIRNAIAYLQLLKNMSEDVFKSLVTCGLLQYEKRTVNFWHSVINYVAALSQENRQIKQTDETVEESAHMAPSSENEPEINRTPPRRFGLLSCVFTFVIVLFICFVFLIVYIDYLCPKSGKHLCPLEWFISLVIEKKYSNYVL